MLAKIIRTAGIPSPQDVMEFLDQMVAVNGVVVVYATL
jgi:hypothetical protein